VSLIGLASDPAVLRAQGRPKPNILFIAVDDLRLELGCYGVKEIKSPHIDTLSKSGVTFTRAYCQQAVCNPSRASLLTGCRPDTIKVWDLSTPLRNMVPDIVTLPQYLKSLGYFTVGLGKIYHNIFPDPKSWSVPSPQPKGFANWSAKSLAALKEYKDQMRKDGKTAKQIDRMRGPATDDEDVPDNQRFDGALGDLAVGQLRALKQRQDPWFLGVGFIRPHLPFTPPKKYWDFYDPNKIPLAANAYLPKNAPALAAFGMYELRDYMDFAATKEPPAVLTQEQQRRLKHGYYASVSFVDVQIGRLLEELERLGLSENTIIVLWSDHGWKLGEHAGWCKQTNYEIDTRVPLIMRVPGAKGNGKHCGSLVELVDIYPTLCDLAGLDLPKHLDGRSFKSLLDDPGAKYKDAAISQFPRKHQGAEYMGYAMRTDRYRYIEWVDRKTREIKERELYDHQTDPSENQNVAGRPENVELLRTLNVQLWRTIPRAKSDEIRKEGERD
jgi:iduronate 2-sulfatase